MRSRAVSQVEIYEALVRNANVFRNCLEIRDGFFVKANGDLFLELCCVWVLPRSGEVVIFAHVAPLWVRLGFLGVRLAGGDDANDVAFGPIAVTDKQQSERAAQAEKNKSVLFFGMIWIINELGTFIDEDGSGFIKTHSMLSQVRGSFPTVLLEAKCAHVRSVTTL